MKIITIGSVVFMLLSSTGPGRNVKFQDLTCATEFSQPEESPFNPNLETALEYLKSVCGKDGINKAVVLKEGRTI